MASIDADTPRRRQPTCAKNTWTRKICTAFRRAWQVRHHPKMPHMNAHIARDIGISDYELARRQHQWPSETTHHPRS